MNAQSPAVGELLREWRERRRLSQLALALDAGVSQRHVSFIESGRSNPSREMTLRLAEQLEVPLRERNSLLLAAGFAPTYPERTFDDPDFAAARRAIEHVLAAHEPNPALAVDRHWHLHLANQAAQKLMGGIEGPLAEPPVNVLRLSLHPEGLAPRILNYRQWRHHVLERLARQIEATADAGLQALAEELAQYPIPPGSKPSTGGEGESYAGLAIPMELATEHGTLRFMSTTTIFGTALDVSLSELAIETFLPADEATAACLWGGRSGAG